jgi:hypothetical protein
VEDICHFIRQFVEHHWNGKNDLGLYLCTHYRFKNFMPGKDWMKSFLENNALSLTALHTGESLKTDRKQSMDNV